MQVQAECSVLGTGGGGGGGFGGGGDGGKGLGQPQNTAAPSFGLLHYSKAAGRLQVSGLHMHKTVQVQQQTGHSLQCQLAHKPEFSIPEVKLFSGKE